MDFKFADQQKHPPLQRLTPFCTLNISVKSQKNCLRSQKRCLTIPKMVPDIPKKLPDNHPADLHSSMQVIVRHVFLGSKKRSQKICLTFVRHLFWDSHAPLLGSQATFLGLRVLFWDLRELYGISPLFFEVGNQIYVKINKFCPKSKSSLYFAHKNTAFRCDLYIRCTIPLTIYV